MGVVVEKDVVVEVGAVEAVVEVEVEVEVGGIVEGLLLLLYGKW